MYFLSSGVKGSICEVKAQMLCNATLLLSSEQGLWWSKSRPDGSRQFWCSFRVGGHFDWRYGRVGRRWRRWLGELGNGSDWWAPIAGIGHIPVKRSFLYNMIQGLCRFSPFSFVSFWYTCIFAKLHNLQVERKALCVTADILNGGRSSQNIYITVVKQMCSSLEPGFVLKSFSITAGNSLVCGYKSDGSVMKHFWEQQLCGKSMRKDHTEACRKTKTVFVRFYLVYFQVLGHFLWQSACVIIWLQ